MFAVISTRSCRAVFSDAESHIAGSRRPSSGNLRRWHAPRFRKWQRQEVCDNERYQRTLENFGYLIQQATVFGQHVHVGCASGDDAIYLLHGLSICATLSPFPPRRHICARNGYAFCLLTTEYFFRLS